MLYYSRRYDTIRYGTIRYDTTNATNAMLCYVCYAMLCTYSMCMYVHTYVHTYVRTHLRIGAQGSKIHRLILRSSLTQKKDLISHLWNARNPQHMFKILLTQTAKFQDLLLKFGRKPCIHLNKYNSVSLTGVIDLTAHSISLYDEHDEPQNITGTY